MLPNANDDGDVASERRKQKLYLPLPSGICDNCYSDVMCQMVYPNCCNAHTYVRVYRNIRFTGKLSTLLFDFELQFYLIHRHL